MGRSPRLARTLAAAAAALATWAVLATVSGGFHASISGLTISSRNPVRSAVAAIALAIAAWALDSAWAEALAQRVVRAVGPILLRFAVPSAALVLFVVGLVYTVRAAVAADAFGYLSQSVLWLRGDLTIGQSFAAEMPWPNAAWTFTPLGYRPGEAQDIVPTYAPGLPLLMAVAQRVSACGPYWIAPAAGALLVLLTAAVGRRLFDARAAIAAAVMVAASPVVIWWSLTPMSDVPVAAFWIAALLAADRRRVIAAALAGALAGIALVIRPNLVPLSLFPLLLTLVQGGTRTSTWMRGAALCAAFAPFVVFVTLVHNYLYGSPFTSGYGTVSTIFSPRHAFANLARYPTWWWQAHGLLGYLFVLSLFRSRQPETRVRIAIVTLFAATVVVPYVFYLPFDDWSYLRFLLPALPIVSLLSADAISWVASRKSAAVGAAALTACASLAIVQGVHRARWDGFFTFADNDQAFVDAAAYVDAIAPPRAIVFAMLHSGSIRYYAGRQTIRYDLLDPAWLDRAAAALEQRGFAAFAVFEDYEERIFRTRFADQQTVRLVAAGPIAIRRKHGGEVRIFALDAAFRRQRNTPIEVPRASRFDCRCPSPRFGGEMVASAARSIFSARVSLSALRSSAQTTFPWVQFRP